MGQASMYPPYGVTVFRHPGHCVRASPIEFPNKSQFVGISEHFWDLYFCHFWSQKGLNTAWNDSKNKLMNFFFKILQFDNQKTFHKVIQIENQCYFWEVAKIKPYLKCHETLHKVNPTCTVGWEVRLQINIPKQMIKK